MQNSKDSPKVYIPPPIFYLATFLAGLFFQKMLPINNDFFFTIISKIIGSVFILIALCINAFAFTQFFKTKNTLITIRPANSLQISGIYSVSRNPMYIGLFLAYTGASLIVGNWWDFLLLPFLFLVIQQYLIKREESYLARKFGQNYIEYKSKVNRWL